MHVHYENHSDLIPNDLEAICLEIEQANSASLLSFRVFIDHQILVLKHFQKLKS